MSRLPVSFWKTKTHLFFPFSDRGGGGIFAWEKTVFMFFFYGSVLRDQFGALPMVEQAPWPIPSRILACSLDFDQLSC